MTRAERNALLREVAKSKEWARMQLFVLRGAIARVRRAQAALKETA